MMRLRISSSEYILSYPPGMSKTYSWVWEFSVEFFEFKFEFEFGMKMKNYRPHTVQ